MSWFKQKTTWAGLVGVITGIGLIATGDVSTGIQTVIGGIVAITMRQAIANK